MRLVCATHKRLRELLKAHSFRDDLYYRLNGLTVRLPQLRDCSDVRETVTRLLRSLKSPEGPRWQLALDVLALMLRHPWPGNLRQLSNVLAAAVAIAAPCATIEREHLPDDFLDDIIDRDGSDAAVSGQLATTVAASAPISVDDMTVNAMQKARERHRGNVSATARELGVSRNTLYCKLPKSLLRASAS